MKKNIVIHISGFPGSGKTTLGNKIKKIFKNKVIVYDTDGFIQHNSIEGKQLLKLEDNINNGTESAKKYEKVWKDILAQKISNFILQHPNKIIVFVGSLDNFGPPNTIFKINANYKFLLNVPLNELMKRYYLRIYLNEKNASQNRSNRYWDGLSKGTYHISGSDEIIKNYKIYNTWHKKNNYTFFSDVEIINNLKKIVNSV